MWDVRVYANNRLLSKSEVNAIGKRCGVVGEYAIPTQYPESNDRMAYVVGAHSSHTTNQ